jgi:hypothetical protein
MERDAWGVINVALHDWFARPCHHHPLKTFPLWIVHFSKTTFLEELFTHRPGKGLERLSDT